MSDYYIDTRDLRFNLFDFLDVGSLSKHKHYADFDGEIVNDIIGVAVDQATELFSPERGPADEEALKFNDGVVTTPESFKKMYAEYRAAGWLGLVLPVKHGGQGAPVTTGIAVQEIFSGANLSFLFMPGLTTAALGMLLEFGTPDQIATYCDKMISGDWTGTMALTEPHAGTAVPDLKTTATPVEGRPGFFSIQGQKIFISAGEHDLADNIVHMVLARVVGDPSDHRGVSLFVVPKVRPDGTPNDVRCVGIEHKMGIHASPTCTLAFGDKGACEGWLLGTQGEGLKCMFTMMNEARIGVGIQGVSHANLAYQLAVRYAKERVQGSRIQDARKENAERVAIIEHPDVRRMLMQMKAVAEGSRALTMYAGHCADQAILAKQDGDETSYKNWHYQLEILTPIVKAWSSDEGFKACELGMQVLGGYGYIREYQMEQLLRDVKIASIYEGTNGIQALDLLGRKVARGGGVMMMAMLNEVAKFINGPAKDGEFAAEIVALAAARDTLAKASMSFAQSQMRGDMNYPALHATSYLQMFGDTLVSWLLLRHAVVAHRLYQARLAKVEVEDIDEHLGQIHHDDEEARFLHAKIATARFFTHQMLPRMHARWASIQSDDRSALTVSL